MHTTPTSIEAPSAPRPTGASGLDARTLTWAPMAAVTAAGLVGTFLPGGTVDAPYLAGSVMVLAVCVGILRIPWCRRGAHGELAAALGYVGFVSLLTLAQGGAVKAGSYSLALLAVMWMALYGDAAEGAVLIVASTLAQAGLSVLAHQNASVVERKALLWMLITSGITLAVHHLRGRYDEAIVERDGTIARTEALARALRELTVLRDRDDVLCTAARVAAEVASSDAPGTRRATYFVVERDLVRVAYQYDESGAEVVTSWPLSSHPPLRRVVDTLTPVQAEIDSHTLGEDAGQAGAGVRHGAWVPILHEGTLHGVLGVAGRDKPVDGQRVTLLVSLAGAVELALATAVESLERMTKVDVLTGCVNRRGLAAAAVLQTSFAVIAVDLDGFKEINDTFGHDAGDVALASFATLIQRSVRAEDVVARVGGASSWCSCRGPRRTRHARSWRACCRAAQASTLSPAVRASLGVAVGGQGVPFEDVVGRADRAMYAAKRAGGMRSLEWSERLDAQGAGALTPLRPVPSHEAQVS